MCFEVNAPFDPNGPFTLNLDPFFCKVCIFELSVSKALLYHRLQINFDKRHLGSFSSFIRNPIKRHKRDTFSNYISVVENCCIIQKLFAWQCQTFGLEQVFFIFLRFEFWSRDHHCVVQKGGIWGMVGSILNVHYLCTK